MTRPPIRKNSTHDAVRHGCYLGSRTRVLHVLLFHPLDGSGCAVSSLQSRPVSAMARSTYRRMTRRGAPSASWTEARTVSRAHSKLRALSFRFCPKGPTGGLRKLNNAENARFDIQSRFLAQAAGRNRKRINANGLQAIRKTAGHKIQSLSAKEDRVRRHLMSSSVTGGQLAVYYRQVVYTRVMTNREASRMLRVV